MGRQPTVPSAHKRILVIEDSAPLRQEIAEVLELEGFAVSTAPNGRAGLEQIRRERPDLVVCDVMMPELDGYATLQAIRDDPGTETLLVLMLTAREERQHMRHGMELGADDYITKPFKVGDLVRAVTAAFDKRARLERQAEMKLEQLREQIATALPHELRTPLACIMGYAEMLAHSDSSVSADDVAALAHQILGAGERLNRMSENALLYVQLELLRQGKGDVRGRGVPMPARLQEIVAERARSRARSHRREADLALDAAEATVAATPAYVAKLVDELVDNAFKFSPPGTPVRVSVSIDGPRALLRIADAGPGMSPEQIAAVGGFVQFERSVREQQGLGLGLSIARGVAMLWDGTLAIESSPGGGTTVTVSLPAATDAAAVAEPSRSDDA
jgi:signal transduction histidine kinase